MKNYFDSIMSKVAKVLCCLLFVGVFCIKSSNAQSHLMFKGIPITGHVSDFVEKMKKAGFTTRFNHTQCVIMDGIFVTLQCTIRIDFTMKTKTAYKVEVELPKDDIWDSLKRNYYILKEELTYKYGATAKEFESFISPYSDGDGLEFKALTEGKCGFISYWIIESGFIGLEICRMKSPYSNIVLTYVDAIGEEIRSTEESKTIQDDI